MRLDGSVQRRYLSEQVGSIAVVSFYADGFEQLDSKQRLLAYYLARAGIVGDEIYTDQVSSYGIRLANLLNHIVPHLGDVEPDLDTCRKFTPEFTFEHLEEVALRAWTAGERFGLRNRRELAQEIAELRDPIFNPDYRPMLTVKNPRPGRTSFRRAAVISTRMSPSKNWNRSRKSTSSIPGSLGLGDV